MISLGENCKVFADSNPCLILPIRVDGLEDPSSCVLNPYTSLNPTQDLVPIQTKYVIDNEIHIKS